jgi:predicted permease
MSPLLFTITTLSLIGLFVLSIQRFRRYRKGKVFCIQLIIIFGCLFFLYFLFFRLEIPVAKGDRSNEIYFVIVLYISMLLGMFAHYGYFRLTQKKGKKTSDFGLFIAPVFTSPIIFLPLLSAFQTADVDLRNLTIPKLMIFIIAFENGFFWKEYFDNRRKEKLGVSSG